jgi:hypothetical protein
LFAVCFVSQSERKKVKGHFQSSVSRSLIRDTLPSRKEAERLAGLLNNSMELFFGTTLTADLMDKFNDISRPTPDRLAEAAKVLGNIKYVGTTSGPLRRDVDIICQLLGIPSVAPNPYVRHKESTNQEPVSWTAQSVFDALIKLSEHKEEVATLLRNLARQVSPKELHEPQIHTERDS